jgi:hypothetical protein
MNPLKLPFLSTLCLLLSAHAALSQVPSLRGRRTQQNTAPYEFSIISQLPSSLGNITLQVYQAVLVPSPTCTSNDIYPFSNFKPGCPDLGCSPTWFSNCGQKPLVLNNFHFRGPDEAAISTTDPNWNPQMTINMDLGAEIYVEFVVVANGNTTTDLKSMVVHGYFDDSDTPQMETFFLQGEVHGHFNTETSCPDIPGFGTIYYDQFNCNSGGETTFVCPTNPSLSSNGQNACLPYSSTGIGFGSQVIHPSSTSVGTFLVADGFPSNAYLVEWTALGSGITETESITTSWEKSSTLSTGASTSESFSLGLSTALEVGFEFAKATATLSADWTDSTTVSTEQAITETESSSSTVSCQTDINCSEGVLYQWKTKATPLDGSTEYIQSCWFACVPQYLTETPKCPAGACSSASCMCCNAYWSGDQDPATVDYRVPGLNGTCHPPDANTNNVVMAGRQPVIASLPTTAPGVPTSSPTASPISTTTSPTTGN